MSHFHLLDIRGGYSGSFAVELRELTIRARRLNILTGPNGCGKTTLLHMLAFLKEPERGEITFAGQPVRWTRKELKALRQRVTLVHQAPYLFAGTVGQNVAYGLKLRGMSGERMRKEVCDALALVSLVGFEERSVRKLSGGEYRRVALARALALNPEVLLLDEPLANLDAHSARVVERVIAALPDFGTTVVMATHDLAIAERLDCDVIRLVEGRLDISNRIDVCRPVMMPAF